MRSIAVAGIGGLVIGHIAWLIAISLAIATTAVNRWVLVVSAIVAVVTIAAAVQGWRLHRRKSDAWAAFWWCLPVSPVVFTLCVLGATYL